MANTDDSIQRLRELTARHRKFEDQKIQIDTQRSETEKQIQQLRAQAEEEFGSSDIEVLKKKLADMTQQNQKKLADYEKTLATIESQLNEISNQYETRS